LKDIVLVVYYHKHNKFSFNALIGALDSLDFYNDLKIVFFTGKNDLIKGLRKIIVKYKKVVLGVSFFTTQIWEINELITTIRTLYNKDVIIIAGGPHPTGDPIGTLKIGADIAVVGEGEDTLIELLQNINKGGNLSNVKGIGYINSNGNYEYTGKRTPISLDKYPPFPLKNRRFGALEITRGCPFVCFFCQTSYIFGTRPRHRSIESICKHVRIMKEENLSDIRFITPNALCYGSSDGKTLNISKLEELLVKVKEIVSPGGRIFFGSFPSEVRPEHVTIETLNLITSYADNDNIIIGAQSGSQKILDSCHRGHTVKDVYKAVDLTLKVKLKANVDFIFGLPNESVEDINLTIRLMEDLVKRGARIHAHSFIPLPMTPFAKEPATIINEHIKSKLKSSLLGSKVFGEWKKQEEMAIKITQYLKTKKIS